MGGLSFTVKQKLNYRFEQRSWSNKWLQVLIEALNYLNYAFSTVVVYS